MLPDLTAAPPLKLYTEKVGNRLFVRCDRQDEACRYRFNLYKGEERVQFFHPTYHNSACFYPPEPGEYTIWAAALHGDETIARGNSEPIYFEGKTAVPPNHSSSPSPFAALADVLGQVLRKRETMFRIALYDYQLHSKDSKLGRLWGIITPLIQVLTFWLVFGLGLRSGKPVDDHPFLVWMLCGLVPWFYINEAIAEGCTAIHTKASMVLRMQFPLAVLPVKSAFTALFDHLVTLGILLVVLLCFGYFPTLNWLNLLYYLACAIVFLSALALVTSTLTMLARDYQKLILSLLRLLFYITPILWTLDRMPQTLQTILKLNPCYYITNGYRQSLLYNQPFWSEPMLTAVFWGITLLLLLWGSWLHCRWRDRFADML